MIKKDRKNRSNDDKNWKILFEKQFENLQNKICKTWINGFSKLSFDTEKVPDLDYLNKQFQNLTDWKLIQTDLEFNDNWGLMQSEKKIPISNFVRTPDELYYCDEPDKWHDLFGHIPPLAIQEYSDMYEYLGKLLVKYKTLNNTYYKQLGTISWYITEVGLIRENGKLKAFGTTLYSSAGELEKAFDPKTILVDATLDSLLEQDGYNRKDLMNKYFVIDSIDQILRDYQVKYLI